MTIAPMNAIWLFSPYTEDYPATSWLSPPPTLHPYRSACGIGVASKNYLEWWAIKHSTAGV